jgi:hypothetical protein
MTSAHSPKISDYALAYAEGRHAAEDHVPAKENPYRRGSAAFRGWDDGHYDERSARSLAIERNHAQLWSEAGNTRG